MSAEKLTPLHVQIAKVQVDQGVTVTAAQFQTPPADLAEEGRTGFGVRGETLQRTVDVGDDPGVEISRAHAEHAREPDRGKPRVFVLLRGPRKGPGSRVPGASEGWCGSFAGLAILECAVE
jgi:hypothetical protein